MKKNQKLVDVYENTKEFSKEIDQHIPIHINTKLIDPSKDSFDITVIPTDTISAVIESYKNDRENEYRTGNIVLNMASYKRAGGGVANGAKSQEEDLFRCTNLCECIPQHHYPLKDGQFLKTIDALVIKDSDYNIIEDRWWVPISVITAPALNLNKKSFYDTTKGDWIDQIENAPDDYERIMKTRIRNIIIEAAMLGDCNLFLGAWGCGVFKNKPEDMAKFFYEILVEERMARFFKKIIFPIINDRNSRGSNYEVFLKQFS